MEYLLMQAAVAEFYRSVPRHKLPSAARHEQKDDVEAVILRQLATEARLYETPVWGGLL